MQGRGTRRIGAALIGAAAAALEASSSHAGLTVDLRLDAVSNGAIISPHEFYLYNTSGLITMGAFAVVSGTNGANDERVQIVSGSFASSSGGLLGNLSWSPDSQFASAGAVNGTSADFDSDGDLDIGSLGTTATGKFVAESGSPVAVGNAIDANTADVRLGTLVFDVTGGAGATTIGFIPRVAPTGSAATWFEDGLATAKTPANGLFIAGGGVGAIIPEPASAATLAAVAAVGLMARRRGKSPA